MNPTEITKAFVDAINAGDIESLCRLMAPEHVFIDSDGKEVKDNEKMREGWKDYFAMVPDYRIEVAETFARDNTAVMYGTAAGTFSKDGTLDPENHWVVPAAWRAVIENGLVLIWQVYVNPQPMFKILENMGML